MLNITTITRQRVDKVVDYYADGADDYYAKDGNAMQWQGAGAEELGLTGEVGTKRFAKLLDGKVTDDISVMRKRPTAKAKNDWDTIYVFRAERRFASGTGQR